jgi:Zn-dependent peptidase ImmA (M78 family)
MGVVVIETPAPESLLEGCCFFVGDSTSERPCVFANSHGSTWFRRNTTLMHEVAHAIFDAETAGAMLDFRDCEDNSSIAEERANAFAQEVMIPKKVLLHVAQANGIKWSSLDAPGLATLVAKIQVGQRTVLRAALAANVISNEAYERCLSLNIADDLRGRTDRALSTVEFIKKHGGQHVEWLGKRDTTIPSRRLRLPSLYVSKVIEALQSLQISKSKAAEMLMIDEDTLVDRFGALVEESDDL